MSRGAPLKITSAWLVRCSGLLVRAALISLVTIFMLVGFLTVLSGAVRETRYIGTDRAAGLAAEGFAEAFTRAYLSWDAAHPERRERRLAAYTSEALEPGAGHSPRPGSVQRVRWTAAVADRPASDRRRLVTVAADTTGGRWFVSVPVKSDRRGFMAVSGYPALVGPPPLDRKTSAGDEPEVDDAQLRTVVRRAVTNYLLGAGTNLHADLDRTALIALPSRRLRVTSIDQITWVRPKRVAVELRASGGGATWTLRYELAVVRRERWYVRSIQTNPTERRSP